MTLVVPVHVDFRQAAELVAEFEHTSVQKWKVFLWWSGLSRRRVPLTCASLVSAWLTVGNPTQPMDSVSLTGVPGFIATPDELFDDLAKYWNIQFEVIEYA